MNRLIPGGAAGIQNWNFAPRVPASGINEPGGEDMRGGSPYPMGDYVPGVGPVDVTRYIPPELRRLYTSLNEVLNPIKPGQSVPENAAWAGMALLGGGPMTRGIQKAAQPAAAHMAAELEKILSRYGKRAGAAAVAAPAVMPNDADGAEPAFEVPEGIMNWSELMEPGEGR